MNPNGYRLEVERHVALVTLDRPETLNSLTFELYDELARVFEDFNRRSEVRAVILTGAGRGFCSGGDVNAIIGELFARDMRGLLDFTRATGHLIGSIRGTRCPVIACVNGPAVGAGAVIAAACDLRIASRSARFGFVFPKVGLSGADMGASWLLPRIVGMGNAAELLFFGDVIDVDTAYRMGLVNRIADDGEAALALAKTWAEKLAQGPAFAHAMTKRMLIAEQTMSLADALEAEAQAQAICMAHSDFRTAYEARRDATQPMFEGLTPSSNRNEQTA